MIQAEFQNLLEQKGIALSEQQRKQFYSYYLFLEKWNKKINLTSILDREDVYVKHFYDSISLSFYINVNTVASMMDIGSGAGFPGIPLKICFPHIQLTILDSLKKRLFFLEELLHALQMEDVELLHGRAEEYGKNKKYRENYDLVTARAVAKLNVLSEYCLPYVKKGGTFAAMKGMELDQEMADAEHPIFLMGGKIDSISSLQLPLGKGERKIVFINKEEPTPAKFPRKPGMPSKKPL